MPTPVKTAAAKPAAKDTTKPKGAPRPGPNFELKKVGESLPPEPVTRRGGGRHADLLANLTAIQGEPGEWFEVVHYAARNGTEDKPSGARKIVNAIVAGEIVMPASQDDAGGGYEVDWRTANYDGSDRKGSVIVARFDINEGAGAASEAA